MKAIIRTGSPGKQHELRAGAFTLTELVVIIAMLALLCLLMVPAFSQTNSQVKSFQCMENMHRLTAAWRMYADENSDKLVANTEGQSGGQSPWANNWLDWSTLDVNTNQATMRASPLARYLNSDITVFRCPADTYLSANQRNANWTARIRSFSMNMFVGLRTVNSNRNDWYGAYRQWLKVAEFPRPADYFVFVDEHPDSINGGVLVNNPSVTSGPWIDQPGSLHNGGANLSFADEHVETHRWQSYTTKTPVTFNFIALPLDSLGQSDYHWLINRTAVLFQ